MEERDRKIQWKEMLEKMSPLEKSFHAAVLASVKKNSENENNEEKGETEERPGEPTSCRC